jgi:hypothetical protein
MLEEKKLFALFLQLERLFSQGCNLLKVIEMHGMLYKGHDLCDTNTTC